MKRILIGNWKNNPASLREAAGIATNLARKSRLFKKLSVFVAPPATYFDTVGKKVKSFAGLASQDIFFTPGKVTYTGVITPDMLKSFGVRLSIVGHSERRALGETSQVVAEKVQTALVAGIMPVVCIGEEVHDPEGNYFEFLSTQLKASLAGIHRRSDAAKIVIAYEPVWAIGKKAKDAMQPEELSQIVIFIRKVLTEIFGRDAAEKVPVLYGGSVDPSNAEALVKSSGIRGFLVGRASLNARDFSAIAEALLA